MADKIDNIEIGQFYTEDYIKDSGLIRSVSWNRLYSTKLRSDKTSQDPDVKNNGLDDVSAVFEVIALPASGGSDLPADVIRGGYGNYFNGDLTPINVPAGVETKLTLTTSGGSEDETWLPLGVSGLWNSTTSQFDFSTLDVGDMVDIRVDGSLTNTGINESFVLNFVGAIGTPSEYTLPFASGVRFIPGTSPISRYNGVFIGSENMRDNPSEFRIVSSANASGFLIDIYIKVLKRNG